MANPLFITFEGIDGCGKSTQLQRCAESLETACIPVLITRNPGGTPLGTQIRQIVLHTEGPVNPTAELLLYMADRAQHMAEVVLPALEKGITVLCDRHGDSTLAYQGYGRGLDHGMIRELNRIACQGRLPDLTLLFDAEPEILMQRVAKRGAEDRLEREAMTFHHKVRDGFVALAKAEPERFHVFDATQSVDALATQVNTVVKSRLDSRSGLLR
jgi:dTMP kinase